MPAPATDGRPILFFDGECNLCSRAVRFVLKRDRRERFLFAALQSDVARELLADADIDPGAVETLVLLDEEGRVHVRSGAALRVARRLRFPWPLFAVFLLVPPFLRDPLYRGIARVRYRWFGRHEYCAVASPGDEERFLSRS